MTTNSNYIALWQLEDRDREERLFLPWRRLFARTADLIFYWIIWWVVAYLGFRQNVMLLHWIPCSLVIFAISLCLMIVFEPFILSVFGTTPGKALFGLRLRRKNGSKLSVSQGYARMFQMLAKGCGFVIIPIYNFVKLNAAYKHCQVEGVSVWDKDNDHSYKGAFKRRALMGIAVALVAAVLLTGVYFGADMPRHRGDLTVGQLESNVDTYWHFHGTAWNVELFYTVNLQFYDISAGYIFDRMDPPEVVIEEQNGVVSSISFEFTDVSRTVLMALPTWIRGYTVSFVGAESNFIEMHKPGGILDSLMPPLNKIINEREGESSMSFTAAGFEISFEIEAGESISAAFSLRKI